MLLGMPFSQPVGESQGRMEALSGSLVAQPLAPKTRSANSSKSNELEMKRLMTVPDKRE